MMTLYHYDHCPYCVKARMIFGLKKVPVQLKALLYDDEKTPVSFIGSKMLPILKTDNKYMPESLDIVRYIDESFKEPQVSWEPDNQLNNWFEKTGGGYRLTMPRWVQTPLEEFETPASRKYFQTKKERHIGSFQAALGDTASLITEMEKRLAELESLLPENGEFWKGGRLSVNDFHLFAFLRMLSVVKGLSFPEKTAAYMKNISKKADIPLHHSIAV